MRTLINQEQLMSLLSEWGIDVNVTIQKAPRGFVAETFFINAPTGRYFAKVINAKSRYVENVVDSLQPLLELHSNVKRVNFPVPRKDGTLHYQDSEILLILFNCVRGKSGFNYDKKVFLQLLHEIHLLDLTMFQAIPKKETFEVNFTEEIGKNLVKLRDDAEILERIGVDLDYVIDIYYNFFEISEKCKISDFDLVITHGDAPGNVVYDEETLSLIDWDDILLAPIERDLWFHVEDAELSDVYPSFTPNKLSYSFYLYKRYLDDLSGFLDEIFANRNDPAQVGENVAGIVKDVNNWLKPLIDRI